MMKDAKRRETYKYYERWAKTATGYEQREERQAEILKMGLIVCLFLVA